MTTITDDFGNLVQTEPEPARAPAAPKPTGLALLRQPVDAKYIAHLPKPTRHQTDEVKNDARKGVRCKLCGTWHHPDVVHLDYVGHAATTARLLETDENWTWEPVAWDEQGLPRFDKTGGLWIKLTVAGQTRLGYGHAKGKEGADPGAREKEVIGDAIRNAAMRFGWALDLWHKGGALFDGNDGVTPEGATTHGEAGNEPPFDGATTRTREGDGEPERTAANAPAPAPAPARGRNATAKPAYTDKQITANLPSWKASFASQEKTAKEIITFLESRFTLTAKQRADIRAAEVAAKQAT